jgi:hypothetical protein
MHWFIRKNSFNGHRLSNDYGWGNGYVIINKEHPLYGKHYNDFDIEVHGGLTFSEKVTQKMIDNEHWKNYLLQEDLDKWVFGFDTCHYNDNLENWTKKKVEIETANLYYKLLTYNKENINA